MFSLFIICIIMNANNVIIIYITQSFYTWLHLH